jgi:hypothetical protein
MKAWALAVIKRVKQRLCGVWGHETLLRFEADRPSLACTTCGWNSPGWAITAARHPAARRTVRARDGALGQSPRIRQIRRAA